MLVRWKQLSGEIARVTHSSLPHLSLAYSSPAPFIVTSKKVKILFSSVVSTFFFFLIFTVSAQHGEGGGVVARSALYTCGTVRHRVGLVCFCASRS